MLALDTDGSIREEVDIFQVVLESVGPVVDISLGEKYSVVLTKSGDIWRVGGDGRELVKIEFPIGREFNISFVAACESLALFATKDGNVFSFGQKLGETSLIELGGVEEAVKKPVKMIKSKDTVLVHFQFA